MSEFQFLNDFYIGTALDDSIIETISVAVIKRDTHSKVNTWADKKILTKIEIALLKAQELDFYNVLTNGDSILNTPEIDNFPQFYAWYALAHVLQYGNYSLKSKIFNTCLEQSLKLAISEGAAWIAFALAKCYLNHFYTAKWLLERVKQCPSDTYPQIAFDRVYSLIESRKLEVENLMDKYSYYCKNQQALTNRLHTSSIFHQSDDDTKAYLVDIIKFMNNTSDFEKLLWKQNVTIFLSYLSKGLPDGRSFSIHNIEAVQRQTDCQLIFLPESVVFKIILYSGYESMPEVSISCKALFHIFRKQDIYKYWHDSLWPFIPHLKTLTFENEENVFELKFRLLLSTLRCIDKKVHTRKQFKSLLRNNLIKSTIVLNLTEWESFFWKNFLTFDPLFLLDKGSGLVTPFGQKIIDFLIQCSHIYFIEHCFYQFVDFHDFFILLLLDYIMLIPSLLPSLLDSGILFYLSCSKDFKYPNFPSSLETVLFMHSINPDLTLAPCNKNPISLFEITQIPQSTQSIIDSISGIYHCYWMHRKNIVSQNISKMVLNLNLNGETLTTFSSGFGFDPILGTFELIPETSSYKVSASSITIEFNCGNGLKLQFYGIVSRFLITGVLIINDPSFLNTNGSNSEKINNCFFMYKPDIPDYTTESLRSYIAQIQDDTTTYYEKNIENNKSQTISESDPIDALLPLGFNSKLFFWRTSNSQKAEDYLLLDSTHIYYSQVSLPNPPLSYIWKKLDDDSGIKVPVILPKSATRSHYIAHYQSNALSSAMNNFYTTRYKLGLLIKHELIEFLQRNFASISEIAKHYQQHSLLKHYMNSDDSSTSNSDSSIYTPHLTSEFHELTIGCIDELMLISETLNTEEQKRQEYVLKLRSYTKKFIDSLSESDKKLIRYWSSLLIWDINLLIRDFSSFVQDISNLENMKNKIVLPYQLEYIEKRKSNGYEQLKCIFQNYRKRKSSSNLLSWTLSKKLPITCIALSSTYIIASLLLFVRVKQREK